MWPETQAERLREEIEAVLAPLSDVAGLRDLVSESLNRVKRGLARGNVPHRPWPLLPLTVCEAISGRYEHALPAAAALELLRAAAEVFDDIEDADSSESVSARYGRPIATNVATTLVILAERAIARLQGRSVPDGVVVQVMDMVNSFYTTACAGQHLDLSLASVITVSEEEYLNVARLKSAATVECTCCVGALLASAQRELVAVFAEFGQNLGMASQIANDIQGIANAADIAKRRITLPVIYALAQTEGETRHQLELAFGKQSEYTPDPAQIRGLLFRTGAIHYAMVKMELYRQRCSDILAAAERAGASVERLKLFLE